MNIDASATLLSERIPNVAKDSRPSSNLRQLQQFWQLDLLPTLLVAHKWNFSFVPTNRNLKALNQDFGQAMRQDHFDQSTDLGIEGQDSVALKQRNELKLHLAGTTFFYEYPMFGQFAQLSQNQKVFLNLFVTCQKVLTSTFCKILNCLLVRFIIFFVNSQKVFTNTFCKTLNCLLFMFFIHHICT